MWCDTPILMGKHSPASLVQIPAIPLCTQHRAVPKSHGTPKPRGHWLLHTVFELWWQLGGVPTNWKKGNITYIFKAGECGGPWEPLSRQPHLCA